MDSFLKAFIKYLLIIEGERVKDKKKKSTKPLDKHIANPPKTHQNISHIHTVTYQFITQFIIKIPLITILNSV